MTTILMAWLLPILLSADSALASQSPPKDTLRKVWYTLDNGLEVAVLPIPSLIAPSMQEVSIVTEISLITSIITILFSLIRHTLFSIDTLASRKRGQTVVCSRLNFVVQNV